MRDDAGLLSEWAHLLTPLPAIMAPFIVLTFVLAGGVYIAFCLTRWLRVRDHFQRWEQDYVTTVLAGDLDEPDVSDFPDEMDFA